MPGVVLENTEAGQLLGAFGDVALGVLDAHADEHEQPDADLAGDGAVHGAARAFHALDDGSHRPARVTSRTSGSFLSEPMMFFRCSMLLHFKPTISSMLSPFSRVVTELSATLRSARQTVTSAMILGEYLA